MKDKKYEFVPGSEITICRGTKLMRIRALRDFGDVKKGDIGGYIESEENLSHNGDCWVYNDAEVFDNAVVLDNARVFDTARVFGDAEVFNDAKVFGDARVFDNARVFDTARVFGDAGVYGDAGVFDTARVYGLVMVYGDAEVKGTEDYIVFKNWWSSGRYFTWTRSNNMWKVGCFYGTGEELIKKAYADSERSGREYERIVKYVEEFLEGEERYQKLLESEELYKDI